MPTETIVKKRNRNSPEQQRKLILKRRIWEGEKAANELVAPIALKLFEKKLSSMNLIYFSNDNVFGENYGDWYNGGCYHIILNTPNNQEIRPGGTRITVFVNAQDSLYKTSQNPEGYISIDLKRFGTYMTKPNCFNKFLAVYVKETDSWYIRPLVFLFSYYEFLKKVTKDHLGPRDQPFKIRISMKDPLKKRQNQDPDYKPRYYTEKGSIEHKNPVTITGEEFFDFLKDKNIYDPIWKLKTKSVLNYIKDERSNRI